VLLVAFAGVRDLWDADEGRYASVAADMVRTGDFLTPRENGLRFVDKPPLVYWMADGAYAVLGRTPLAARLPCVVSGAGLALAAFLFGAAWSGRRGVAWCAAMVVATSVAGMGFSRTVTMDMPLAASAALACYAGWRALDSDARRWRALLGLFVGLGLLAKGPLGAVLPALVALAWAVVGAPWKRVLRLFVSPTAIGVALAVAVPWYAAMEARNAGYLRHFLIYEHFGRFAEKGNREFAPVWLYVATLATFLLPWLPFLPGRARRLGTTEFAGRPRATDRFAWAWAVVLLVFYSAGRNRLFTYCLPVFLPLAVLSAATIADRLADGTRVRFLAFAPAALGFLALGCAVVLALGIPFEQGWKGYKDDRHVLIGVPAAIGSLPLVLMPLWFRLARTPRARGVALFLSGAIFFWGVDLGCARADAVRSPRELARLLATVSRTTGPNPDAVVCLDLFPQGLRFYEDVSIRIAGKQGEIVEPWASKDGAGVLLSRDELAALWASNTRVVLVVREDKAKPYLEAGARVLGSRLAGAQRSDLVVVENRPRAD
jgi:4-amino-4-deoxy-L-arabinose transferase-like glycosyltransferase